MAQNGPEMNISFKSLLYSKRTIYTHIYIGTGAITWLNAPLNDSDRRSTKLKGLLSTGRGACDISTGRCGGYLKQGYH